MPVAEIGLIGGTGIYDAGLFADPREHSVATPYGEVPAVLGMCGNRRVAFITRHGRLHNIPPHRVNYRANIWALKLLGVKRIVATAAVGSLNPNMKPGDFVVYDQFLDFTKGRESTFHTDQVVHTDVSEPYCSDLRELLFEALSNAGEQVHPSGCYVCTEGPRYESAAEIRAFRILGGDLVGMTGLPEVVLAREAGLCYAGVAVVTNFAAGMSGPLAHEEVVRMMNARTARLREALRLVLGASFSTCKCMNLPG